MQELCSQTHPSNGVVIYRAPLYTGLKKINPGEDTGVNLDDCFFLFLFKENPVNQKADNNKKQEKENPVAQERP